MKPVNPMDLGFLLMERRNQPMHVGGLMLCTPPKGQKDEYVRKVTERVMTFTDVQPPFNRLLRKRAGVWFWDTDHDFDLESHVYHLALPRPGRVRELLALVSKLHSSLMDRSKPLWEVYVIEGVEDGRIALYTKIHHALVDGVAAMRMLQKATADAADTEVVPLWALPPKKQSKSEEHTARRANPLVALVDAGRTVLERAGSARTVAREVLGSIRARRKDPDYVSVFQAPRSMLNQRISGQRRFAAQGWPLARIKAAGKQHGATINDVVLAMCAAALRRYLLDMNALPSKPLVSMVPVSMRKDDSEGGNQVAMVLANLATDRADPIERLATIKRSVKNSKDRFARMSQGEIMGYLGVVMSSYSANLALGIMPTWQAFNIVISNVPGPKAVRYWNGARIDGMYPVSIVIDGSALNITLNSYGDNLEFGLIACRRTIPHMQNLLQYLEDGLAELEA